MPDSSRIEMLTDGVIAIAATLLVLDVRLPAIEAGGSTAALWRAVRESLPSLVAFFSSCVLIFTFWLNLDSLGRVITRYPLQLVWLNLVLLIWICLVPFATRLITAYPSETAAVLGYGLVVLLAATTMTLYACSAFWLRVMPDHISRDDRLRLFRIWWVGPALYLLACVVAFVDTRIAIAIYIGLPLVYFVPALQERMLSVLGLDADDRS